MVISRRQQQQMMMTVWLMWMSMRWVPGSRHGWHKHVPHDRAPAAATALVQLLDGSGMC
jgi:hypothetical protein